MPQSKSRKDQLKELLKQKNISIAVLAMHIGTSRSSLNSKIKSSHNMSEQDFNYYKTIVDSIDTKNYYKKYVRGDVSPKSEVLETRCKNKIRIQEFIAANKIKKAFAARICNLAPHHFCSLINLSKHYKLSDTKANVILSKLEEYVKNKEKDNSI